VDYKDGSTVDNVPDTLAVEFHTFPSLPRANFSSCKLDVSIVANHRVTVTGTIPGPIGTTGTGIFVEYQANGVDWVVIGGLYYYSLPIDPPGGDEYTSIFQTTFSATIPSSTFVSDLDELVVRMRTVTATYTYSGWIWKNRTYYGVWDIQAQVS
jgi:hypothetical protein